MLYVVPDNNDEPMMTVAQFFSCRPGEAKLTQAKLRVAERIAQQSWVYLYGTYSCGGDRLNSRDIKYPKMYLEELEQAMIGTEDKTKVFQRMGRKEVLTRLTNLGKLLEGIADKAPEPNILFSPTGACVYRKHQATPESHAGYLYTLQEDLPEIIEEWECLKTERGLTAIMDAVNHGHTWDKHYYGKVIQTCKYLTFADLEFVAELIVSAWRFA